MPCSRFRINTTLHNGGKRIFQNYGVRGTDCAPAVYTRHATLFGTIDRNIHRFSTVTVINDGIKRAGALIANPYNIYHRTLCRFNNPRLAIVVTEDRSSCVIAALNSLLPCNFNPTGLRWGCSL